MARYDIGLSSKAGFHYTVVDLANVSDRGFVTKLCECYEKEYAELLCSALNQQEEMQNATNEEHF